MYFTECLHNTIRKIWVSKYKDDKWVTDTYNHFRDHYGVSESMLEFVLTQP